MFKQDPESFHMECTAFLAFPMKTEPTEQTLKMAAKSTKEFQGHNTVLLTLSLLGHAYFLYSKHVSTVRSQKVSTRGKNMEKYEVQIKWGPNF